VCSVNRFGARWFRVRRKCGENAQKALRISIFLDDFDQKRALLGEQCD